MLLYCCYYHYSNACIESNRIELIFPYFVFLILQFLVFRRSFLFHVGLIGIFFWRFNENHMKEHDDGVSMHITSKYERGTAMDQKLLSKFSFPVLSTEHVSYVIPLRQTTITKTKMTQRGRNSWRYCCCFRLFSNCRC